MYTSDLEAANAIRLFNNYMIRPSWQLGKLDPYLVAKGFVLQAYVLGSRYLPTYSADSTLRLSAF